MGSNQTAGKITRNGTDSILVTGGAGFIGSNFVLDWFGGGRWAGRQSRQVDLCGKSGESGVCRSKPAYTFVHGDICDAELVAGLLREHSPRAVVHFAAESHVDRSIVGPEAFLRTNIDGTFTLLQAARAYYESLAGRGGASFAFCTCRPMRCTAR